MANKNRTKRKTKDTNMNIKIPLEEYEEIKQIAEKLGLTLSSLVRVILFKQLDKARKSKDPQDFLKL